MRIWAWRLWRLACRRRAAAQTIVVGGKAFTEQQS
jgi:glycine betaine/choline ABC-type transport system substrate-binding protein